MAYQFCDGFDNYSTLSTLWDLVNGTVTPSTAYRRFAPPSGLPGQGIKFVTNGSYLKKNLSSNQQTLIIKFAVNFPSLGNPGAGGNPFLNAEDAGTSQWTFCVTTAGALVLHQGLFSAVQAQTGPGLFSAGLWYGLEVEVTVAASGGGSAVVWVNGIRAMNVSGINTQASANAYANQVLIGDISDDGLVNTMMDDFRIWDNTGSTQNAALGNSGQDSRIVIKLPSGAGSSAAFTPNGAAANWQCVDDNPPDGDTTYVSGSSSGLIDDYAMPSAGLSTAPAMVVARSMVRKDDGATRTLEIGVKSGSSYSYGAGVNLGSSYAFIDSCIPLDPATSAAWTAAGADAAHHAKQETA